MDVMTGDRQDDNELDEEILVLQPSLASINTTRFLQDPVEQSLVLRTELQALKLDLESFYNTMV